CRGCNRFESPQADRVGDGFGEVVIVNTQDVGIARRTSEDLVISAIDGPQGRGSAEKLHDRNIVVPAGGGDRDVNDRARVPGESVDIGCAAGDGAALDVTETDWSACEHAALLECFTGAC